MDRLFSKGAPLSAATSPQPALDQRSLRWRLERAGQAPDESRVVHREVANRLLEQLDLIRLEPASILDASAAAGTLIAALRRRYARARLLAFEAAHRPVADMRRAERRLWRRRAAYVCARGDAMPLPSNSIELFVSNLSLHREPIPDPCFAEVRRVLAPGSPLLLATCGPATLRELAHSWRSADGADHVHPFADMHDVGDALARAGFVDVVMSSEELTVHYPDLRTLYGDLKALGVTSVCAGRRRGLHTGAHLARVAAAYEVFRRAEGLPVSIEVVYAHAWAPAPRSMSVNFPPAAGPNS